MIINDQQNEEMKCKKSYSWVSMFMCICLQSKLNWLLLNQDQTDILYTCISNQYMSIWQWFLCQATTFSVLTGITFPACSGQTVISHRQRCSCRCLLGVILPFWWSKWKDSSCDQFWCLQTTRRITLVNIYNMLGVAFSPCVNICHAIMYLVLVCLTYN